MKTRYLILIIFLGLLYACQPQDSQNYDFEYTVDKVVCQANSNYFVADGVSQLGLEVKLYTKQGTYTDVDGNEQPQYMEIPQQRWRDCDIKFFDRSGKEYDPKLSSSTLTPGVMEFYAEVDGMRSSKPVLQLLAEHPVQGTPIAEEPEPVFFKMNVRAANPVPALKRFPVIFHIIDSEKSRNELQEVNSDAVYYVIDLFNNVFGRKFSRASNGANPNLEFVPAVRNPDGELLEEPGINRVYLDDARLDEFDDSGPTFVFVNYRSECFWDQERYLNIWIINAGGYSTTSEMNRYVRSIPYVFKEGDYDAEAFPIPPGTVTVAEYDDAQLETWLQRPESLEAAGIVFAKSSFANLDSPYTSLMSVFLGAIPNSDVNSTSYHYGNPKGWVDDYCDDTFAYNFYYGSTNNGGLEGTDFGNASTKYTVTVSEDKKSGKPGYPWIIYKSANTGERSSPQSVITQDQSRRIEWAVNNAVARQAWRNSYAITPVQ